MHNLDHKPGSLQDLSAPLYRGELWPVFGGDSGGGTTKEFVELASTGPHLIGMFKAKDIHQNLEAFMRHGQDWILQLEHLVKHGLKVTNHLTGEKVTLKVRLFLNGDYAYLCEKCGHQGCASCYPILRDLTPSSHLRKAHRDGSPHHPGVPGCAALAVPRSPESFTTDFLANLLDTRKGGDLRKNGQRHHSIIARCLFPLTDALQIVPASLHIGLYFVLLLILYLQTQCDILDGTASPSDLARIGQQADPVEGEEDEDKEEQEEQEAELTDEGLALRSKKATLEREWAELSKVVIDLQVREKEIAEDIQGREHLAERVRLAAAGKVGELEVLARSRSKVRVAARRFKSCTCCILSAFDKNIAFKMCSECEENCHELCQVDPISDEEVMLVTTAFICRVCLEKATYSELEQQLKSELEVLHAASSKVSAELAAARLTLSAKKGEVKHVLGPHRQKLEDLLSHTIGVSRCEFPTLSYVGNHGDKIVDKHELLAPVLDELPEAKAGFLELAGTYKPVHFLMKAKRELKEAEINLLEQGCHKLGELVPRVLKGSTITPKLHELVFYVPKFAREWRMVGGMREEGVERSHPECNGMERVLKCVRKEEERLAQIMVRVELRKELKASDLATAKPRKFTNAREDKRKRY